MKSSRPLPVFLWAVAIGAIVVATGFGWLAWQRQRVLPAHVLASGVAISQQLQPAAMSAARGDFTTVIDMRPDGEVPGQPSSAEMAAAARAQNLQFVYVPVPHGDIPDAVVDSLAKALVSNQGPVLLYCHSGRRAARSWSLVEASRPGGMNVDEIIAAVKASGQDASDLRARLEQRVKARKPVDGTAR